MARVSEIVERFGHPGAIAPAAEIVPADRWDNLIREWGVVYACEWFGHHRASDFTEETVRVLIERTEANPKESP